MTLYATLRHLSVSTFAAVTVALFLWLIKVQPHYYIDEIFHVPQTLRFCDGRFFEWDQKITTFPGLYLMAIAILAPFGLCDIDFFRGINLMGTFSNFYVIYEIVKIVSTTKKNSSQNAKWTALITSLNIALLPPLYFLLFLFYTDVMSTNMVLLMYLFHLRGNSKTSAFMGILAVLFRQTNIVWLAWISLEKGLDILDKVKSEKAQKMSKKNTPAYISLLLENVKEAIKRGRFSTLIKELLFALFPYVLIVLGFITFVVWNGGIVLGDRNAHVATIHIPQLFYCSVFICFFAWPFFLPHLVDYLRLLKKRWFYAILTFTLMALIVRFNTLVHPYLLADNRHYTFYVWNKIIGRYYPARFLFIPFYGFCLYAAWRGISHLRFLSQVGYFLSVFVVIVPQLLLEPRYFFIPYILWRIDLRNTKPWQIIAEFLTILLVNVFQFYVFSKKVFYWDDDEHPQRISW
ncbi:putative Dol-P-Glc:Glc(2)Man(9)GlcNAc(2)-PP-Dol alpha-1,2-glucosyltransferase [Athalia rosae]|uniref:putative Dol-P-Glc:Glc(2)Man(9)GlcNAc(2)-PP-Dol alpha-1,2-glucosyltransferase n=1 Tax=Athalia rosae TaxID=37344 RepID=UPI0020339858|nr:putative Dol-P-Glc:Glc(2)Man(9)GlcNAc(2)-PP-Dol alpha-1,2-glucosyltransferase [Athalia rosae]XP_020706818.2 putative Dol-P-Glc:Glc(2)Man(9)GlcNAc(2)-PP-Dol alpha-1,2-glucosyltransferase [Athalia rosae]